MNPKVEICKAFDKQAVHYEQAAKIQQEIGQRLFERLDYIKLKPRYILDLGCGTGIFLANLKKKYPQALIIGLDIAFNMLKQAQKKKYFWQKNTFVNGDMSALPFKEGLFDLIFANQVIHWSFPLQTVIAEIQRVLSKEGCLMFSTLGPDTFGQIRDAWLGCDTYSHTNAFMDMHDLGDCLLRQGLSDPVVDMEMLTVHYPNLQALLNNLKLQGVRNIHSNRYPGLMSKEKWLAFNQKYEAYKTLEGKYPLTYEVVYGQAWKGPLRNPIEEAVYIPLSNVKLNRVCE